MPSPDITPYIDLTVYDADPQTLYDAAIAAATVKLPEWTPREGNTEVVLLEALALEASELVYAINRLPGAIAEIAMRLHGLTRDLGTAATATVTFTVADAAGYTIPAGTRVMLDPGAGLEARELTLLADLVIAAGATTGTGAVTTAGSPTSTYNGTVAGTPLTVLDPVPYVSAAVLATALAGGVDPEDGDAFRDRGASMLSRMVTTLVLPAHFTSAALEQPFVARATTVDLSSPDTIPTPATPLATPSTTGGTLPAATYTYRVSAANAQGETLATATATCTTTGTTGSVTVSGNLPTVPAGTGPITAVYVYGRTGTLVRRGTATLGASTYSFVDTNAAGPGNALPTTNTTAPVAGTVPGHVTVGVAGPGGAVVSTSDKITLASMLASQALANLTVHVTDATLTTVAVTAAVKVNPNYSAATVLAAVTAAVQAYLSPDTWAWSSIVYRNELVSVMDAVEGVDRVDTVTTPAADVALPGIAPLTSAGVVTITAA